MLEESGEAMKEAVNFIIIGKEKAKDNLEKELIQTAAMCLRALIEI